jgi:hypothetical protein
MIKICHSPLSEPDANKAVLKHRTPSAAATAIHHMTSRSAWSAAVHRRFQNHLDCLTEKIGALRYGVRFDSQIKLPNKAINANRSKSLQIKLKKLFFYFRLRSR